MKPYYEDDFVTLYHGDSLEHGRLWSAEFLVTDPPYGIGWRRGTNEARASKAHAGIANDADTTARDTALQMWGRGHPAVVFGSLAAPLPPHHVQTLIWHKPPDAGVVGSVTGFRRDAEAIFLCGHWLPRTVRWSSVLRSGRQSISQIAAETGHPHTKPVDLMARLIDLAPGYIVDPFCGSGSTLVAAKLLGRRAVGFEIHEPYCAVAAQRLSQEVLDLEAA